MSPCESGAQSTLLESSAGHTLRSSLNLRPTEFGTFQSVAHKILEQCNVCPAFSWRHSYGGLTATKIMSKLDFPNLCNVFYVNHCSVRDL